MHHARLTAVLFAIMSSLPSTPALAAAATWVSASGRDSGSCQISTPCRTFAFALKQTNAFGSVNVLSSGNFGPLLIDRSVNINAEGVEAMIQTVGIGCGDKGLSAAICVAAGTKAVVSLTGLIVEVVRAGTFGIYTLSVGSLHIRKSVVRRAGQGISFHPSSATRSELYVSDTVLANNGAAINVGFPASSSSVISLSRLHLENNDQGIVCFGPAPGAVTMVIRDSVISGAQGGHGVPAAFGMQIMIERTSITDNATGVSATQGAAISDRWISGDRQ